MVAKQDSVVSRVGQQQQHPRDTGIVAQLQRNATLQCLDVARAGLRFYRELGGSDKQHQIPSALVPCMTEWNLEPPGDGRGCARSQSLDQGSVCGVANWQPRRVCPGTEFHSDDGEKPGDLSHLQPGDLRILDPAQLTP